MDVRYPRAAWRPLSDRDDEPSIVPRLFIVHTMVGYLAGTESMFRKDGYSGTESTFGLGGPWDGARLDGALYQWQRLDREADAQYDGNPLATSIETSDGGDPSRPWSAKQLDALVALGAWWADQTKRPIVLATAYDGEGFGYHEQYPQWNKKRHACPGAVREKQYREIVIPRIRAEHGHGHATGDDLMGVMIPLPDNYPHDDHKPGDLVPIEEFLQMMGHETYATRSLAQQTIALVKKDLAVDQADAAAEKR